MSELQKAPSFDLSAMSGIMGNITPPQLPSLKPNAGIIGHWIHGKKMDMASKSFRAEAEIAGYQRDMVVARTEMIMTVLLAGQRYDTEKRRLQHEVTMMELTEYEKNCICRKLNAEANEAEYSARTAELDYKARQKAMRQEYGDDF